jgi:hypothetical protein
MKYLLVFIFFLLNSCGVSKGEYVKAINENELLKNEISILRQELDQYKYGEERMIALIGQSYNNKDIAIARQNINIFLKYYPESIDNNELQHLVKLVEQEERVIREAKEANEIERIRLERLASIGKTEDNPLIVDGKGSSFNEIAKDIIFNRKNYNEKYISIINTWFDQFNITSSNSFITNDNKWFENNEAYQIPSYTGLLSDTLYSNKFYLFFHPIDSDVVARKLMIELKGKRYTSPHTVGFVGKFLIISTITQESNVFLVTELTLNDTVYKGSIY